MQKQGMVGVYKLYKLGKGVGNTFSHDFKKLERDLHIVTHEYADLINHYSTMNGSHYEMDEKATKLYWEKKPFKDVKEFVEFEELKEDVTDETLDALKAEYEELAGKKAHHLWKADKLTEKIEELKK